MSRITLWKVNFGYSVKSQRLVGSFLVNICLSLGRYFSDKQKEGILNSVLCRSLELLDSFSIVHWMEGPEPVRLSKFIRHPPQPPT